MSDLHGKITNIRMDKIKVVHAVGEGSKKVTAGEAMILVYELAHRDARHAAAELACQADTTIREQAEQIRRMRESIDRIIDMCGDVNLCSCGRSTGIPAIVSCARTALAEPVKPDQPDVQLTTIKLTDDSSDQAKFHYSEPDQPEAADTPVKEIEDERTKL